MQIKNTVPVTDELPVAQVAPRKMTDETMQRDISYRFAQKIAKEMLDKGLISECEYDSLSILNREKFSPYLSELMA